MNESSIHSIRQSLAPLRSVLSTAFLKANEAFSSSDITGEDLQGAALGKNPILTAADVTDYGYVSFVADPFLYISDDWHLFFEVQNGQRDPTAVIGHAVSTDSGRTWGYDQVVLNYDRHLAFPYVFEVDGTVFMTPAQGGDPHERSVTLFEAANFPYDWQPVTDIIRPGYGPVDPIVFEHDNRWWLVVGGNDNETLYAYYSDSLRSSGWTPHDQNPIVTDRVHAGRPAGRPTISPRGPVLFLQDNTAQYGDSVRAFQVTELTPTEYRDEPISENPLLSGNGFSGWNASRAHHIDAQDTNTELGWVCVTDGDMGFGRKVTGACWSIGTYVLNGPPRHALIK